MREVEGGGGRQGRGRGGREQRMKTSSSLSCPHRQWLTGSGLVGSSLLSQQGIVTGPGGVAMPIEEGY